MERFIGLLGVLLFVAVAVGLSTDRARIPWRTVLGGLLLQLLLAVLLLSVPPVIIALEWVAGGVSDIIGAADAGSAFVFGNLAEAKDPWGFVFAIRVLPVIVFFASLMAILYHWGLMQRLIWVLAWVLRRSLGVTGTEAMMVAANVFVGQTEAPLCVKPYIEKMTRSQLMVLMTGGFATIAGSVLVAYILLLAGDGPDAEATRTLFAKHLITASLMSAPAAFVLAKIMVPETEDPIDAGLSDAGERTTLNALDAAAGGASDGLRLALNVAAALIAFVALIKLLDTGLITAGHALLGEDVEVTVQSSLGLVFAPVAWTMGVPWAECRVFGGLLGEKIAATEFIAYLHLAEAANAETPLLSERSVTLATYALCGFANLPSIGIQIGGLTALAPSRRSDLAALGLRAMMAGAMASWMTACIAGLFV